MVSPATRPAAAAGDAGWTVETTAPGTVEPVDPLPIPTPRKPGRPIWIVAVACPDSIWWAMLIAWAMGMAKPTPAEEENRRPPEAAVSMPMTWPAALTRGPPESPGWMGAFIWMSPVRVSALAPPGSLAVIVWLTASTVPATTAGVPPTPPALPIATTGSPGATAEESPTTIGLRPDTPWIWMTAMSSVGSSPTTVAV